MDFGRLDFTSQRSLYLQIVEKLEQKIVNKEIPVGQKLPTQEDLRKIFNVSLDTVKESISCLVKGGYVSCRPTHGTFVINSSPDRAADLKKKNEIAIINFGAEVHNSYDFVRSQKIIDGIEERAKENGIYLLTSTVRNNKDMLYLLEKQKDIAGLIIVDAITKSDYRKIKNLKIPFVLVGDLYDAKIIEPEVDIICNDDFQATYLATKHLIDLGHSRIGYVMTSLKKHYYSWELEKLRGYREALKGAGIELDKNLVIEAGEFGSEFNVEAVELRIKNLIKQSIPFTALVCKEPELYKGASIALKEAGLKVPEDVSIVGIGCSEITNTNYEWSDMGKAAVERLIERLTNPDWKPGRIVVPYRLVDNGTTKKLG